MLEKVKECLAAAGREIEQTIYDLCKSYNQERGNWIKCYKCCSEKCSRHIEAKKLIQELEEKHSAIWQQDTKRADEKAQAGSSQQIKGVAGSSQGGKKMKVYIAGAITDNPKYKEQFNNAEEKLKEAGYEVINPAKNQGYTYREYINAGLFQLMSCDAIYLLKGYEHSTGATLEHNYAMSVGIKVMKEDSTTVEDIKGLLSYLELGRKTGCDIVEIKREYVNILCEVLEEKLSNARCE